VADALNALGARERESCIGHLQRAEVALKYGNEIRPVEGSPIDYGCTLALGALKRSIWHCLRAAIKDDRKELIRARVCLEDAAMCIVSARQQDGA
jgi:hypothetical protein